MYQNKHCTQNCRKDKYKTVKGYYGNSQVKLESVLTLRAPILRR